MASAVNNYCDYALAMKSKSIRIDRLISKHLNINRRDTRLMLAQRRIEVNDIVITKINTVVSQFDRVVLDGEVLRDCSPVYIMLNKPVGVISATQDRLHKTVIDLLPLDCVSKDLHIVGRLDLNTTGLLLLTNDGTWSRKLMSPVTKVSKVYQVTLKNDLNTEYISAFAAGMFFPFEGITTQPATLTIRSNKMAEVILMEGKYHQIKRMFGRFRNPVLALHRSAIGNLNLDKNLKEGESRMLTTDEVSSIFTNV